MSPVILGARALQGQRIENAEFLHIDVFKEQQIIQCGWSGVEWRKEGSRIYGFKQNRGWVVLMIY